MDQIDERVKRYERIVNPRKEPIVRLTLDREYIDQWDGPTDAGRKLNINYKNINAVCKGKRNIAGEFKWMYLSDYLQLCKIDYMLQENNANK